MVSMDFESSRGGDFWKAMCELERLMMKDEEVQVKEATTLSATQQQEILCFCFFVRDANDVEFWILQRAGNRMLDCFDYS